VLYGSATTSALNIRATSLDTTRPETVPNPEENTAVAAMAQQLARWRKKLPKEQTRLFGWLMKQNDKTVTDLLVLSTSLTLEAVSARHSFERDHRAAAIELAPAFDMANYWEATAPGFFSRLNETQMAQALTDSGHKPLAGRIQKLKRDATVTADALKGRRWLPAPLRSESESR
jgi:ParB family chromosome partitioning protein